jgi:calcineurin-like phosphoesterase
MAGISTVGQAAGTHTHVPTADARIMPAGTAAVSDVGMVGPVNSVIGVSIEPALRRFLTQRPARFTVPGGPVAFNAVLVTVDEASGRATAIERIDRVYTP